MAKNIIIFQNIPDDNNSLIGFKIFDKISTNRFLKAVSLLSDAGEKFEMNDTLLDYDKEKFEILKISSNEIKILSRLFNIEDEESFGIFPDAINDAYEYGLMSDDDENNDNEDYYEEYE